MNISVEITNHLKCNEIVDFSKKEFVVDDLPLWIKKYTTINLTNIKTITVEPYLIKNSPLPTNSNDFMQILHILSHWKISYPIVFIKWYLSHITECNLILKTSCFGLNISSVLTFLVNGNYFNTVKPILQGYVHDLYNDDYKIIFFAIYFDIQHMFDEIMNTAIITTRNLTLFLSIIKFSLFYSRIYYFNKLIVNSIPEIKIIITFNDYHYGIMLVNEFENAYAQLVNVMYSLDQTQKCNCSTQIESILHDERMLYSSTNNEKTNCKTLLMLMYYNLFEQFKVEYEKIDLTNECATRIILKCTILTNNLEYFKYVTEHGNKKLRIVDDLATYVLLHTENIEFVKYLFQGNCRTKKTIMCECCKINTCEIPNNVEKSLEWNYCENYINKRTIAI